MKKKKLLFISYHFPPTGGGMVQRSLKFVKYLPAFGWDPIVLTVSNPSSKYSDGTLLRDLPQGVCVHKICRMPILPFAETYRTRTKSNYDSSGKAVLIQIKSQFLKPFLVIVNKLFYAVKYIANNFVYIPDRHVGWLPGAVIKGVFLVKKNNLKIIYATGEPWTSFLAAFLISKVTKIPYILDFRDPWILNPVSVPPGAIYKWICNKLERLCIQHADRVIFTCNRSKRAYRQKYRNESVEKFITITHGYEPEDFDITSRTIPEVFTISYVGTLYLHYRENIDNLFRAISNILRKKPEMRYSIQIKFVGVAAPYLDQYSQKYGIKDIVRVVGYVSFKDSIQYMVNSTVLLLFGDIYGLQVSGKMYEYLAAKRPILAVMSTESDVAFLVRDNNAGISVDPRDLDGIEKAIVDLYKNQRKELSLTNIKKYERKELAGKLANEFDAVTMENNQI